MHNQSDMACVTEFTFVVVAVQKQQNIFGVPEDPNMRKDYMLRCYRLPLTLDEVRSRAMTSMQGSFSTTAALYSKWLAQYPVPC